MNTHTLYRLYDKRRRLLYVGMTLGITNRFKDHRGGKPWWSRVVVIKLQHFGSREELKDAERAAIATEGPLYNVVGALRTYTFRARPSLVREARAIADKRGEDYNTAVLGMLDEYISEYKHLLDVPPS